MALVCHPPIQKIILSGDRGEDEQTIKVTGVTCETASHFVGTALRYVAGTPFLGPSIALRAVLTLAFKNLSHAQQEVNTSACIHAVRIELSVHSYNRAIRNTTQPPPRRPDQLLHVHNEPASAAAVGRNGRPCSPPRSRPLRWRPRQQTGGPVSTEQSTRSLLTMFSPTSRRQLLMVLR